MDSPLVEEASRKASQALPCILRHTIRTCRRHLPLLCISTSLLLLLSFCLVPSDGSTAPSNMVLPYNSWEAEYHEGLEASRFVRGITSFPAFLTVIVDFSVAVMDELMSSAYEFHVITPTTTFFVANLIILALFFFSPPSSSSSSSPSSTSCSKTDFIAVHYSTLSRDPYYTSCPSLDHDLDENLDLTTYIFSHQYANHDDDHPAEVPLSKLSNINSFGLKKQSMVLKKPKPPPATDLQQHHMIEKGAGVQACQQSVMSQRSLKNTEDHEKLVRLQRAEMKATTHGLVNSNRPNCLSTSPSKNSQIKVRSSPPQAWPGTALVKVSSPREEVPAANQLFAGRSESNRTIHSPKAASPNQLSRARSDSNRASIPLRKQKSLELRPSDYTNHQEGRLRRIDSADDHKMRMMMMAASSKEIQRSSSHKEYKGGCKSVADRSHEKACAETGPEGSQEVLDNFPCKKRGYGDGAGMMMGMMKGRKGPAPSPLAPPPPPPPPPRPPPPPPLPLAAELGQSSSDSAAMAAAAADANNSPAQRLLTRSKSDEHIRPASPPSSASNSDIPSHLPALRRAESLNSSSSSHGVRMLIMPPAPPLNNLDSLSDDEANLCFSNYIAHRFARMKNESATSSD